MDMLIFTSSVVMLPNKICCRQTLQHYSMIFFFFLKSTYQNMHSGNKINQIKKSNIFLVGEREAVSKG